VAQKEWGRAEKLQRRKNCLSSKLFKVAAFVTSTIDMSLSNRTRSTSVWVVAVKKGVDARISFASQISSRKIEDLGLLASYWYRMDRVEERLSKIRFRAKGEIAVEWEMTKLWICEKRERGRRNDSLQKWVQSLAQIVERSLKSSTA